MSGRIRDQDLEELRRKASLADVAAEYMKVKKAGRLFKALCPFHSEKSPSFSIDPAKGLYHCFGCQKGGDVFTLLQELEGLTFAEAAERLAARVGLTLTYERASPAERRAASQRERLIEAHRRAIAFYHQVLMGPEGADARAYLKSRGFTKQTVEDFRLGLAPPRRDDLCRALLKGSFSEDELVEGSLAARTDSGPVVDRFRGRLMFPVHDLTGNPIAFGARRLGDRADGPKYLNSAESPIYHKGRVLYALDRAKGEIVRGERAVVVEGYTDVIALHQAGVREAVATCGTALGPDHFTLLARFSHRAVLSFDSDTAGQAAAERAFEHAQAARIDARVLILPDGSDPADFVSARGGEAFRALAERAAPLVEYRIQREVARFDVEEPEQRARALQAALPILAAVDEEVVRREYARRLAGWVRVDADVVFSRLEEARRTGTVARPAAGRRLGAQARHEQDAVKLALQFPAEIRGRIAELSPSDFSNSTFRRFWEAIATGGDMDGLASDPKLRSELTRLSMEPPQGVDPGAPLPERLADEIFARLKEFSLVRQIGDVKERLQRLNPEKHPEEYDALFKSLAELEGRRRRLTMVLQGGSQ